MSDRMTTDGALLTAYIKRNNEADFAEIVNRHRGMVYRVCLRTLGDAQEAEDATQAVFAVLLRKARSVTKRDSLSSWLHGTARNVARYHLRSRIHSRKREEDYAMNAINGSSDAADNALRQQALTELDAAIGRLSSRQREALVLRFLRGHSVEQAAQAAGVREQVLRRRASDGLARLRKHLRRCGLTASTGWLLSLLESEAAAGAPQGLASKVVANAPSLAAGTDGGVSSATGLTKLTQGAVKMMAWTHVKQVGLTVAITGLVVTGAGTGVSTLLGQSPAESRDGNKRAESADEQETKPQLVKTIAADERHVVSVAVSPDGQRVVTGGADTNQPATRLWSAGGRKLNTMHNYDRPVNHVCFSPDGKLFAQPTRYDNKKFSVLVIPVDGGKKKKIGRFDTPVNTFDFSPDSKWLAIGGRGRLVVWNLQSGQMKFNRRLTSAKGTPEKFYAVDFSPDGSKIAAGTFWSSLYVVDAKSGKVQATARVNPGKTAFQAITFSPDGKQVLAGSIRLTGDGELAAYSAKNLEKLGSFGAIRCSSLAIRNGLVAAGHDPYGTAPGRDGAPRGVTGQVRVFDLESRELQHTLKGHSGGVASLAFHPNKNLVYAGDNAGKLKIWRLPQ